MCISGVFGAIVTFTASLLILLHYAHTATLFGYTDDDDGSRAGRVVGRLVGCARAQATVEWRSHTYSREVCPCNFYVCALVCTVIHIIHQKIDNIIN